MPNDFMERYKRFLSPSTLTYYQEPVVVDRAKGVRVTDHNGRDYLDFFGGILTVSLEHGNEHVNAAVKVQLEHLSHISTLYPTAPVLEVAEALAKVGDRLLPEYFRRWMSSPLRVDPQTKMPAYFNQGQSALFDILDGDAGQQIEALHHYIRLGGEMVPPEAPGQ